MNDILQGHLRAANSEVRKVTTVRAHRITGAALPAIAIVASVVTATAAGAADQAEYPATGAASIGLYLSVAIVIVVACVFGAANAGAEFRYASLPVTALFTQDRDRLAGAKLLTIGGFALAAALVVELLSLACLIGIGRDKVELTLRLLAVLGGALLATVCWALIGAGLALLLRTSTGAITGLLGWLFIIEPITWVAADGFGGAGFATLLPGAATISTVAVGSFPDSVFLAPTPAAIIVLLLWTAGIVGAGWWTLRGQDL